MFGRRFHALHIPAHLSPKVTLKPGCAKPSYCGNPHMSPQRVDFHFARFHRGDKFESALARHEHYLFGKLKLKPGMRVLEVGCRSGLAAMELVNFAGVNVVGIENDAIKVKVSA